MALIEPELVSNQRRASEIHIFAKHGFTLQMHLNGYIQGCMQQDHCHKNTATWIYQTMQSDVQQEKHFSKNLDFFPPCAKWV